MKTGTSDKVKIKKQTANTKKVKGNKIKNNPNKS